ncbi:DUF3164 family protein [Flavobacterium hydrophilum]|uniref:DUF3164 domain-containing protein n=1 Tax=Flavobacterium hydrophilum TaxID=2211445 RepID=A0A2V4C319_9FLAO|nr:DUF3164 family protein [Flavobacterium hydrophilum]PXY44493.1 hypothetical protein DMB68_13575 [Flavobacterium hydrophilum]
MNTETPQLPDLTKFSAQELKDALAKVESKKDLDRQAYKDLVEQTVPKVIFTLCSASEMISNAKTQAFKYFEDILKLKADVYGIKEKQQSHTFSCDGAEITIGYRVTDGWDDTVSAGIAKVEKFITSLAKDAETSALVTIVFNLLKKDAKGNLKGSRVLELQKLTKDFNNEEFTDGVRIIADAYKPVRSVWYIEAALIGEDGTKTPIPLSASSVDFSQGYKFEFNKDEKHNDTDLIDPANNL